MTQLQSDFSDKTLFDKSMKEMAFYLKLAEEYEQLRSQTGLSEFEKKTYFTCVDNCYAFVVLLVETIEQIAKPSYQDYPLYLEHVEKLSAGHMRLGFMPPVFITRLLKSAKKKK